jgi:undecaprenyl-diphosphatase
MPRAVALFAAFLVLGWVARTGGVAQLELRVLDVLQSIARPGITEFVRLVTWSGDTLQVIGLVAIIVLTLLLLRRTRATLFALCVGLLPGACTTIFKALFQRPRPVSPFGDALADFAYPSGHAALSMSVAVILAAVSWRTRLRWPVLVLAAAYALAVGYSRTYLGVHHPTDVLGGWLLVWAVASVAQRVTRVGIAG